MAKASSLVVLGASAGGLQSLEAFFVGLSQVDPEGCAGMGFLVVQHLSPDHRSVMVDLLQRHTAMRVVDAQDGTEIEAGTVYHIQPASVLTVDGDRLSVAPRSIEPNDRLPIDRLLHSVARHWGAHAAGIILSGTGSDGTVGSASLRESGGLVIAEDPDGAKFDGMPRSVIQHRLAELILTPEEMGRVLCQWARLNEVVGEDREPEGIGQQLADEVGDRPHEQAFERILSMLSEQSGIHFLQYKHGTLRRRIQRRLMLLDCDSLEAYAERLQRDPLECANLQKELIIGVTRFFRDPAAFDILEREVIPQLFEASRNQREIRIWVAGCSTGEEAYSIAMLVHEYMSRERQAYDVKIFATDIDQHSLQRASAATYPFGVAQDLATERLDRYTIRHVDHIQIAPQLREMIVFAQHDLTQDAPFTRVDLTVCRNLLIYLNKPTQQRVLGLLNYSLRKGGFLFLGGSEVPGEESAHLRVVDARWRIYQATEQRSADSRIVGGLGSVRNRRPSIQLRQLPKQEPNRLLDRIMQELLSLSDTRVVLIFEDGRVHHTFGDLEGLLRTTGGSVDASARSMFVAPLADALDTALSLVREGEETIALDGIHLSAGREVRLILRKGLVTGASQAGLLVAMILPVGSRSDAGFDQADGRRLTDDQAREEHLRLLEDRLSQSESRLSATIEELEASNEELQATNEELMSSNEELQSTNEELQSLNEELYTVNNELQSKVTELSVQHMDMANLLEASGIATLFLEGDLVIRRFTPRAGALLNLLDRDEGRPITDIAHPFREYDIAELCRRVQEDGVEVERRLEHVDGRRFDLVARPYLTSEGNHDGIVLNFADVTRMAEAMRAMEEAEGAYRELFATLNGGSLIGFDRDLTIRCVSGPAFEDLGFTAEALVGRNLGNDFIGILGPAVADRVRQVFKAEPVAFSVQIGDRHLAVGVVPLIDCDGLIRQGMAVVQPTAGEQPPLPAIHPIEAPAD